MFTFFSTELESQRCMGWSNAQGPTNYSESGSLSDVFLVYLCHCACLTFFSKSTLMHVARNSCCEAFVVCTLRSKNWAAKAVASAVDRIWCSSWVHAGCFEVTHHRCLGTARVFHLPLDRAPPAPSVSPCDQWW